MSHATRDKRPPTIGRKLKEIARKYAAAGKHRPASIQFWADAAEQNRRLADPIQRIRYGCPPRDLFERIRSFADCAQAVPSVWDAASAPPLGVNAPDADFAAVELVKMARAGAGQEFDAAAGILVAERDLWHSACQSVGAILGGVRASIINEHIRLALEVDEPMVDWSGYHNTLLGYAQDDLRLADRGRMPPGWTADYREWVRQRLGVFGPVRSVCVSDWDGIGPANPSEVLLKPLAVKVLRALQKRNGTTASLYDLSLDTGFTRNSVGPVVTDLISRKLAARPLGRRSGVVITLKGKETLAPPARPTVP